MHTCVRKTTQSQDCPEISQVSLNIIYPSQSRDIQSIKELISIYWNPFVKTMDYSEAAGLPCHSLFNKLSTHSNVITYHDHRIRAVSRPNHCYRECSVVGTYMLGSVITRYYVPNIRFTYGRRGENGEDGSRWALCYSKVMIVINMVEISMVLHRRLTCTSLCLSRTWFGPEIHNPKWWEESHE